MDLYGFTVKTIDGDSTTLDRYRGQPLLIVNVASRCGFTPQYKGLEALYRKIQRTGDLSCSAFPAINLAGRSPAAKTRFAGSAIGHYSVTFPLFAKIDVNGPNAHPLYRYLKSVKRGLLGRETIAWNFTKFLAGRNGEVLRRYGPRRKPEAIEKDVAGLV